MDIIAAALKIDPLELRKQNGYDEGDKFVTEEPLSAVGLKQCLNEVAKSIGWGKKVEGKNETNIKRGKGLACMIKATITPSIPCAVVNLYEDANLPIYTVTLH